MSHVCTNFYHYAYTLKLSSSLSVHKAGLVLHQPPTHKLEQMMCLMPAMYESIVHICFVTGKGFITTTYITTIPRIGLIFILGIMFALNASTRVDRPSVSKADFRSCTNSVNLGGWMNEYVKVPDRSGCGCPLVGELVIRCTNMHRVVDQKQRSQCGTGTVSLPRHATDREARQRSLMW